MGRDHTLALYRTCAAVLFAGWMVAVGVVGAQHAEIADRRAQLALRHPPQVAP